MRRIPGMLAALALVFAVACVGDAEVEETDETMETPGMVEQDTTMMAPPMDTMMDTTMMDTTMTDTMGG